MNCFHSHNKTSHKPTFFFQIIQFFCNFSIFSMCLHPFFYSLRFLLSHTCTVFLLVKSDLHPCVNINSNFLSSFHVLLSLPRSVTQIFYRLFNTISKSCLSSFSSVDSSLWLAILSRSFFSSFTFYPLVASHSFRVILLSLHTCTSYTGKHSFPIFNSFLCCIEL